MRWLAALTLVFVLALGGTALAQKERLSKANARVAAELAGYNYVAHHDGLTTSQIGTCKRRSATRFTCRGQASGEQLKGCEQTTPYQCFTAIKRCAFTVPVHKAGYTALGRVRGVSCTTRETASA